MRVIVNPVVMCAIDKIAIWERARDSRHDTRYDGGGREEEYGSLFILKGEGFFCDVGNKHNNLVGKSLFTNFSLFTTSFPY